jgi:hypothetical protein
MDSELRKKKQREAMREYRKKHPEYVIKNRQISKNWEQKHRIGNQSYYLYRRNLFLNLKYEVLSHYSGEQPKCKTCGFDDIRALCLDHINNDGNIERLLIGKGKRRSCNSEQIYSMVKKNNFPERYQVLCFNCNQIKAIEVRKLRYKP